MLQKYKTKREEGFTIIEVLIVLAIAGLILLIVFLAVPALQRNARNNARNNEGSRLSTTVTECLANKNGITTSCDTLAELGLTVNAGVMDGYQQFTNVIFGGNATVGNSNSVPIVRFGVRCGADGTQANGANPSTRDFVVLYNREPGAASANNSRCLGSQ